MHRRTIVPFFPHANFDLDLGSGARPRPAAGNLDCIWRRFPEGRTVVALYVNVHVIVLVTCGFHCFHLGDFELPPGPAYAGEI